MPRAQDLPDGLKDLHFRNALQVRHNPDFNTDIAKLIEQIKYPGVSDTGAMASRRMIQRASGALALVALIVTIGIAVFAHPIRERTD